MQQISHRQQHRLINCFESLLMNGRNFHPKKKACFNQVVMET
jgi:hypothetical protein